MHPCRCPWVLWLVHAVTLHASWCVNSIWGRSCRQDTSDAMHCHFFTEFWMISMWGYWGNPPDLDSLGWWLNNMSTVCGCQAGVLLEALDGNLMEKSFKSVIDERSPGNSAYVFVWIFLLQVPFCFFGTKFRRLYNGCFSMMKHATSVYL